MNNNKLMKTTNVIIKSIIFFLIISVNIIFSQEDLFPKIHGWQLSEDNDVYDSNNLWDIIDGAADLFLEYSFVDLHIGSYINQDSIEVKVEIYRHNNSLNAFGIYSQERNPDYHFIKTGTQGYIAENILNFLDGVFYVKLSTYNKGNSGQEALKIIAKQLDLSLKQDNSFPKILNCFPEESKQLNTEKYTARNFLGYSFLNSATTALYKDGNLFTLFIINLETSNEADSTLKKFINAQDSKNISYIEENVYKVDNKNNGLIVLAVEKNFIFGLINCPDQNISKKYIYETRLKLRTFL